MPLRTNPFHQVYYTELIKPVEFTSLFSPFLISDTLPLFQQGNILLEGVQGSGKSMLLALFKPEIRIAYQEAAIEFPVPIEFRKFVSGGINLIRCGAIDFGQRMGAGQNNIDRRLPNYFGDFVNYWIIDDIFESIRLLSTRLDGQLSHDIGIKYDESRLDSFAIELCKQTCWFNYFNGVKTFKDFTSKIQERINDYRRFLEGHFDEMPHEIDSSTTVPGEPISQTVRFLWSSGVLSKEVQVYIRIDQCEEMVRLEAKAREKSLHCQFRQIINKMIGTRDPSISYRLGGRKYAFRDTNEMAMLGTTGPIEDFRNYKSINLDDILRRREQGAWLFPDFAEDVFKKRLIVAGYSVPPDNDELLAEVLGAKLTIENKAELYAGSVPKDAIIIEDYWPKEVKESLENLAETNVLCAKLGEAWVRQKYEEQNISFSLKTNYPWETKNKVWWRKERKFLASLQIAARRQQKMIWARKKDILDLSGGNILIFLSMLQHVWAAWLRSQPRNADWNDNTLPRIENPYTQSEGIEEASDRWYDKIKEEPEGDSRRRFVAFLGMIFRNSLRSDKKMSYPGHHGISFSLEDLEDNPDVYEKLQDASAYGVMVDKKHTPKNHTRGESRKWYLHPILAPHFQIPATHTKEPMYVSADVVRSWLIKAKVLK